MNFILILRILMVYNSTFMNFCHCLSIHFNFAPNILIIPDVGPTNHLAIGHSQSDIWHLTFSYFFVIGLGDGWFYYTFCLFCIFYCFLLPYQSLLFVGYGLGLLFCILCLSFSFFLFLITLSLSFDCFLQLWLWPLNYFWYLFNVRCALYGLEMYIFIWLMACLAL